MRRIRISYHTVILNLYAIQIWFKKIVLEILPKCKPCSVCQYLCLSVLTFAIIILFLRIWSTLIEIEWTNHRSVWTYLFRNVALAWLAWSHLWNTGIPGFNIRKKWCWLSKLIWLHQVCTGSVLVLWLDVGCIIINTCQERCVHILAILYHWEIVLADDSEGGVFVFQNLGYEWYLLISRNMATTSLIHI